MSEPIRYDYVVVGGGMAADAGVRGIRAVDETGSVALFSRELHPPYDRPPLSKGLWMGDPEDRIWRRTEEEGVDLLLGRTVTVLDPEEHTLRTDEGHVYRYGSLLVATGGTPVPLAPSHAGVVDFRTLEDYRRLLRETSEGSRVAVVGGGFIGSEMAAALTRSGRSVTLLFPEEGICRRLLPPKWARALNAAFRERGVDVRAGTFVESVEREGTHSYQLHVSGGTAGPLQVEAVVTGLGIRPATDLAHDAGLHVDDGIVTDETLRTSHPDIFAAGDVARVPCPPSGNPIRVEHEDHANATGMAAGMGMAGHPRPYDHLPFFYSDFFELGYRAVGRTDPDGLEIRAVGAEPEDPGVVYYLDDGRIQGVLLWNAPPKTLSRARSLVLEGARIPAEHPTRSVPIPLEG